MVDLGGGLVDAVGQCRGCVPRHFEAMVAHAFVLHDFVHHGTVRFIGVFEGQRPEACVGVAVANENDPLFLFDEHMLVVE